MKRPRDKNGWRIPNHGTLARKIYDMAVSGKSGGEIRRAFPDSPASSIRQYLWSIRHPDTRIERQKAWLYGLPEKRRKAMTKRWRDKAKFSEAAE